VTISEDPSFDNSWVREKRHHHPDDDERPGPRAGFRSQERGEHQRDRHTNHRGE
jgi:hypothetical protein